MEEICGQDDSWIKVIAKEEDIYCIYGSGKGILYNWLGSNVECVENVLMQWEEGYWMEWKHLKTWKDKCFKVNGYVGKWFRIGGIAQQGCVMSALFFYGWSCERIVSNIVVELCIDIAKWKLKTCLQMAQLIAVNERDLY